MDIQVRHITRTFGSVRANDAISLSFAAGQIHGILGENGAGKSTLMKILAGFVQRDSGEVLLRGKPVRLHRPADALRAGVGMVYQDPLDIPPFTVLENFLCAMPRSVLPSHAAARQRLAELAERAGFALDPDTPLTHLTVGQRQQLEIVRLLARGVGVLILDEPTTGITASQKDALFTALRRLAAEGRTILFVSHKLEEIAELCHTVSVLRAGRVMGEGRMMMPQPAQRLLSLMFGQRGDEDRESPTNAPLPHPSPAPSSPPPPTWQLEQVTASEGTLTLRRLTLEVQPGTIVGLAGIAGSGQRVLLRVLAGFLRPEAGQVWLQGHDLTGASVAAFQQRGVHLLPADRLTDGLIGSFSLTDHIALEEAAALLLPSPHHARRRAESAIAEYSIKATPTTPMSALSGGNQQRAMLALLPPRCTGLLLEHPTRGLDIPSARFVWQKMLERRDQGTALVFASADLDELLTYSDTVLVFFGGRVSSPHPRTTLSTGHLAALIGGVGFA